MDAAAGEVAAVDFFHIDSFNLDDFDFDLAADEFCDAYAAFVADADNYSGAGSKAPGGWLADSGIDDAFGGSSKENMSEYVSELERLLLENNDDGVDEEISVDDYFGDLLAALEDAEEEQSLDAREDDQPASRKRARHKIRGTTMTTRLWGELEVTTRHPLASMCCACSAVCV